MAYHNHLAQDITLPPYANQHLAENQAVIAGIPQGHLTRAAAADAGKPPGSSAAVQHLAGGPTWLNSAILRHQPHQFVDGSFLHLQTASDSSTSPAAVAGQWFPRAPYRGADDDVAASSDSIIVSDPAAAGDGDTTPAAAGEQQAVEGTWQNVRYKAEILAHPLYEQLLSAHVACLRIATPVDQLPRIDAQLAQTQHVVAKYSVLGAGHGVQMLAGDDKELDQFM